MYQPIVYPVYQSTVYPAYKSMGYPVYQPTVYGRTEWVLQLLVGFSAHQSSCLGGLQVLQGRSCLSPAAEEGCCGGEATQASPGLQNERVLAGSPWAWPIREPVVLQLEMLLQESKLKRGAGRSNAGGCIAVCIILLQKGGSCAMQDVRQLLLRSTQDPAALLSQSGSDA